MIRRALIGLPTLALIAVVAAAQEREAFHIVRPGDTLRGLTRQYLGTESRWRENWELNPHVENPDLLTPGQRIRIKIPHVGSPVPNARVLRVSGTVDERPAPVPWLGALDGDLLLEKDGIRTGPGSSSVLLFTDGTELALVEGSQVILARAGRSLEGVDQRSVEIVEGQAELASIESGAPAADIEIVVGGAVAKPRSGARGELQTRARKAETGGAAVMMYEGSGAVEAAGRKVEVERGMGTAVPESGPPAPPEKLLPAVRTLGPPPGARLPYPDPELAWEAVDGAASYTLELCTDAACREAYLRQTGLSATTTWRAESLAVATHYWRVTAVSPSGLDGYPSEVAAFTVLTDERDREAPVAVFELDGPTVDRRGEVYFGSGATVRVAVTDEPGGVASWHPLIDGRRGSMEELTGVWTDGAHSIDVAATDRLGNEATREGPRFTVDASPPTLIWEVGGDRALAECLPEVDRPERWQRRWVSWQKHARRVLRRRNAGPARWVVVAWNAEAFSGAGASWSARPLRWRERRRHQAVRYPGGSPALVVAAPRLVVPGSNGPLGDRFALIQASDAKAGVQFLSLRTTPGAAGPELEIETVDRLGNRSVERVPFLAPD